MRWQADTQYALGHTLTGFPWELDLSFVSWRCEEGAYTSSARSHAAIYSHSPYTPARAA